jgi:hypothetical protein
MTPNHNLCLQWTIEVDDKDLGLYAAKSEMLTASAGILIFYGKGLSPSFSQYFISIWWYLLLLLVCN